MGEMVYKISSDDALVCLARTTIEEYLTRGHILDAPALGDQEPHRAGCFVTLHMCSTGDLRGCIGTIEPTQKSLADEIVHNAIASATRDPRFPCLRLAELEDLSIGVDVLFEPLSAAIEDLDPHRFGVIVTQGYKKGLLLPDIEGIETVEEQLFIACMKAGIDPQSSFEIERFEVVRHI